MLVVRLIAILLLAYLIFLIIGILLLSTSGRSRKGNRIRADADKAEELVLCIECTKSKGVLAPPSPEVRRAQGFDCISSLV